MATISKAKLRQRVGIECRRALRGPDGKPPKMSDKLGTGGLGYDRGTLLAKIGEITVAVCQDKSVAPPGTPVDVPGPAEAKLLVGKDVYALAEHITKEIVYDIVNAKHTVKP